MRYIICHYHIFKNSGTSFDTLLSKNYGDKHISFDGPFPFFTIDQEQLARIIMRKNEVVAFSSHQIKLPAPASLDFQVLPVVFIRHPLLRVQSIYNFKRRSSDGTEMSMIAKKKSFDEWVTHCFEDGQKITHISNAQAAMLGGTYGNKSLARRASFGMEYDICQATRNLQNVPLLARTEYFDEDVRRFTEILAQYSIDFKYKRMKPQNATSNDHGSPLNKRLSKLENALSEENYQKLLDANAQDLFLLDYAGKIIERDSAGGVRASMFMGN